MRVVATAALLCSWVGTAGAGGGRKVEVTSQPSGATVYLNDKESGPQCTTPCSVDAPVGDVTLIIELRNYAGTFESVSVPKRGRVPKVSVTLEPAVGTIVVKGPPGATINVDDEDKGTAPATVDASEETHHVVVTKDGKTLFDDFVEVTTGQPTTVTPKRIAGSGGGGPDEVGGGGGTGGGEGEGEGGDGGEPKVHKSTSPHRKRDRFVSASALVDIGFRSFTYSGVETPQKLRAESESGQVLAGPLVELWPGELTSIAPLRGLSLLARLEFGVNSQNVTGNGIMDKTNTFWQSMELSLRYRHTFAEKITAEAGIGYVRDQFQFEGTSTDIALVPDVDYKSVRVGLRASYLMSNLEPFVAIENRVVTSGGKLQARFQTGSEASGYAAALGFNAHLGSFVARLAFNYLAYSWDLKFDPMSEMRATGASDTVKQLQLAIGYQY